MELVNGTRMIAGYNLGVEPSGREVVVVVVKGTFVLPKAGEPVRLDDEQVPLTMADTFTGEPGVTATLHESDFAPHKQRCDVLLVGNARAPEGRDVTRLRAGWRVGTAQKVFDIIGDRVWQVGISGITASDPQRFTEMPVSYDRAFGGTDRHSEDEREHDAYVSNPVGRGWHKHLKRAWIDGEPLPNTEEPGKPVRQPNESYRPMAFGPLGRGWPQRARFAGTYDQQWLDGEFPFLPRDFDDLYYQAAPEDQQIPTPVGPLEVVLHGFTTDVRREFILPHAEVPVHLFPKRGGRENHTAVIDTIVFEPDRDRFTVTFRAARPLRRSMHEIAQVLVGSKSEEWWWKHEEARMTMMNDLAT